MPSDASHPFSSARAAQPGPPAAAVLETVDLRVRYGGTDALKGVDLAVSRGELVVLIGPNGAGKTTFLDAVTGFARSTGSVRLAGAEVSTLEPHARARRGLGRTFQSAELFADLTVRENLNVALPQAPARWRLPQGRAARVADGHRVEEALALLGVEGLADARPDQLTIGQLKLVGVARALVGGPAVLCLDEPAAGLTTTESRELGTRLRRIVDAGTPLLLIDHDMGLVLGVSDRVVVLDFGEVIASGVPTQVRDDPRVVAAYLGSSGMAVAAPA